MRTFVPLASQTSIVTLSFGSSGGFGAASVAASAGLSAAFASAGFASAGASFAFCASAAFCAASRAFCFFASACFSSGASAKTCRKTPRGRDAPRNSPWPGKRSPGDCAVSCAIVGVAGNTCSFSFAAIVAAIWRSGETSSSTKIERPCVATIRSCSRGCVAIAIAEHVGTPCVHFCHAAPPSNDTYRPNSVPSHKSSFCTGSSSITRQ